MDTVHKTEKQSVYSFERISNGISVSVTPIFIDQESRPEDHFYLWAYQVRIENKGLDTIRILDREWSVVDARGMQKLISGTGVFEDRPILKPGDAFEYTNTIPLSTTSGLMSGKYALESTPENSAFEKNILEVEAPAFSLDSPYEPALKH